MQSRLFKNIINAELNGKPDKNFVLRCKFSDEISTQEQALEIFHLLEEFDHKYNNYFKEKHSTVDYPRDIKFIKTIFFNIAHSYPAEGVFENLSLEQIKSLNCWRIERYIVIGIDYLKQDFQNETNVEFLRSAFKPITEKIIEFRQNCDKQIKITEYFTQCIRQFLFNFQVFVRAIQETLDLVEGKDPSYSMMIINENTSLNLSLDQKRILESAKYEILKMKDTIKQIVGLDNSMIGGYSSLSNEQKYLYHQFPKQFEKWEKAFAIINDCRFKFRHIVFKTYGFLGYVHLVKEKLLNVVNGIEKNENYSSHNLYQYTEKDLAIFKFPRAINTSQYKLNDKNLLAETTNVIQNFDDTPLRHPLNEGSVKRLR